MNPLDTDANHNGLEITAPREAPTIAREHIAREDIARGFWGKKTDQRPQTADQIYSSLGHEIATSLQRRLAGGAESLASTFTDLNTSSYRCR